MAASNITPSSTGGFRTVRRHEEHYEVHYKSFAPGVMLCVAYGLDHGQACTLKDRLNDCLHNFLSEINPQT